MALATNSSLWPNSSSPVTATFMPNVLENASATEGLNGTTGCVNWLAQHALYQAGNALCLLSYLAPNGVYGMLFLHSSLIFGFTLLVTWAAVFVCSPDILAYNAFYLLVNIYHASSILWRVRPVRLTPEMREAYRDLFKPLNVPIYEFRKLVAPGVCRVQAFQEGEFYAKQMSTRCDRLGLLISGSFIVRYDAVVLHRVRESQFIDSSEFEQDYATEMDRLGSPSKKKRQRNAHNTVDTERFVSLSEGSTQRNSSSEPPWIRDELNSSGRHGLELGTADSFYGVSIQAAVYSRAIVWRRAQLLRVLRHEPFLAAVFASLIGRDITDKLYALQNKIRIGSAALGGAAASSMQLQPLDIRLPSVANLLATDQYGIGTGTGVNQSPFEQSVSSTSRRFVEQGQFERRNGSIVAANASASLKESAPAASSSHNHDDHTQPPPGMHRKLTSVTEYCELCEAADDESRAENGRENTLKAANTDAKPTATATATAARPLEKLSSIDSDSEDTNADVFYTPHASLYLSNESLAMRLAFHDNV